MPDQDRDVKVSGSYRALDREEPPRALDEAILAAARRELETRPAPLVAPTGRRHWYVPLAAAAVIVLSVVVTLHVQREQPGPEFDGNVAPAPPAQPAPKAEPAPRVEIQTKRDARKPPPAAPASQAELAKPLAGPAESAAGATSEARRAQPMLERQAVGQAAADAVAKRAEDAETPERTLERIAQLRREGRHKEADEAYAEFRRRHPDYRIPERMLEQVQPR